MNNVFRIQDYLRHLQEATERIATYIEDVDEMAFLQMPLVQDAVIRNLEIIGEACNNILKTAPEFAEAHPEIPWTSAIGARNALSHGYFKVDLAVVWTTVQEDLPALYEAVTAILADMSSHIG